MIIVEISKVWKVVSTNFAAPVLVEVFNICHVFIVQEDVSYCEKLRVVQDTINTSSIF